MVRVPVVTWTAFRRASSLLTGIMDLPPSLYIAHPNDLFRAGLVAIATDERFRIVGCSGHASEALEGIVALGPTVALVGGAFPDPDGFKIARLVAERAAAIRVVITSSSADTTHQARAVAARAVNCIAEGSSAREVVGAIRNADSGKALEPHEPFAVVSSRLSAVKAEEADRHLTHRERQVLRHLAYGLSNEEIANALAIGLETVKTHVHKLLRKMAMRDRTQVAVWAVKNGVV